MGKEFVSYEKNVQGTITRVKHIARFRHGTSAFNMKDTLKRVPDKAVLIEVSDCEEACITELYFEEEQ